MGKSLRHWSFAIGAALALLWIASLGNTRLDWLPWLELAATFAAFAVVGTMSPGIRPEVRSGSAVALALGLFILWYVTLSANAEPWIVWWNFSLGWVSLFLGIAAGGNLRSRRKEAAPVEGSVRHPFGAAYPYEWGPGVGPERRPEAGIPTIENPDLGSKDGAAA
jgi:hypothetical protein